MKKTIIAVIGLLAAGLTFVLFAADHIDAPAVGSLSTGSTVADITDYYAFESPSNSDNYVFVCNVLGLTAPTTTADATFDEDVMYEFNIDNNADNVEDLVIQCIFRDGEVFTFGAVPAGSSELNSKIVVGDTKISTEVSSYGAAPTIGAARDPLLLSLSLLLSLPVRCLFSPRNAYAGEAGGSELGACLRIGGGVGKP